MKSKSKTRHFSIIELGGGGGGEGGLIFFNLNSELKASRDLQNNCNFKWSVQDCQPGLNVTKQRE